jgi:hypothetical protein
MPTTEKQLSIIFGLLIGGMWMGEILLENLGGTSVFGNFCDVHPHVYAIGGWCALGAVGLAGMGGLVAAYRGPAGFQWRLGSVSGVDYSVEPSCS